MIISLLVIYLESGFKTIDISKLLLIFKDVSVFQLLVYSLYTFLRLCVAYLISLFLALLVVFVVTRHKKIENFLVPIFDILQSVPVLAFFPLIIVVFSQLGLPELAAQLVLIIAMFWSILFGALGGLHLIPEEIFDAARVYNANGLQMFLKVIVPSIFPHIVTGSVLSFGEGWNVIIISEYINYGNIHMSLPGLGNLLSVSAGHNSGLFIASLLVLVGLILIVDRLVWHRLTEYGERFKFE
ncbi:MAG: ABC transporter permease subunit [Candidatus Doudnabacteria bacterium]